MLRLRPTTISLTPNDIHLAHERIDSKRRATVRANRRVQVRRGPERSRDEAIIEQISSLQPRRAEHYSSEDFSDYSDASKIFRHRSLTDSNSSDDSAHDLGLISHQQTTRPKSVLASNRDPYIPLQLDGHFETDCNFIGPLTTATSASPSRQLACLLPPESTNLLVVLRTFSQIDTLDLADNEEVSRAVTTLAIVPDTLGYLAKKLSRYSGYWLARYTTSCFCPSSPIQ
jgi:hypothetical protein